MFLVRTDRRNGERRFFIQDGQVQMWSYKAQHVPDMPIIQLNHIMNDIYNGVFEYVLLDWVFVAHYGN